MSNIVPFGKYKGQPAEAMAADRQYCEWLLSQPWAKDKLGAVYNIVINHGAEPQDTPEHNEMQAKFLDEAFCLAVLRQARPAWFATGAGHGVDILDLDAPGVFATECTKPVAVRSLCFEAAGWDVEAHIEGGTGPQLKNGHWLRSISCSLQVECKPSLGDDFPGVLRQVQRYNRYSFGVPVVLVRRFCASSVPFASVRRIFAPSGFDLVLEGECRL